MFIWLAASAPAVRAAKKRRKTDKRDESRLGLIAGSVFRPDGRSLPGAEVIVTAEANPKWEVRARSDARGEFAVRAPAGPTPADEHCYRIRVQAEGFQPAEKTVSVYEAQKTSANFILQPQ